MAPAHILPDVIQLLIISLLVGLGQADAAQALETTDWQEAQPAVEAHSLDLARSFRRLQDTQPAVDDDVGTAAPEPSTGGNAGPASEPATTSTQTAPGGPAPADPAPAEPADPTPVSPVTVQPTPATVEPDADPPGVEPAPVEPTPGTSAEPAPPPADPSPADPVTPAVITPEPDTVAPETPVPETPEPEAGQPDTAGQEPPDVPPAQPNIPDPDTGGAAPPPVDADDDDDDGEDADDAEPPDVDATAPAGSGDEDDDPDDESEATIPAGGTPPTGTPPPTGGAVPPSGNVDPPTGTTDPPTDGGAEPPTDGGTDGIAEPPTDGGAGPPTDGGAGPPTDGGAGPPTDGGAGPPTDGGAGSPTDGGAGPPTDGGAEPPDSTPTDLTPTGVTPTGVTPTAITPTGVTPTAVTPTGVAPISVTPPPSGIDPDVPTTPEEPTEPETDPDVPSSPTDPPEGTGVTGSEVEDGSAPSSPSDDGSRLSTGVLAAIVAGVAALAGLVIIIVAVKCCCGARAKKKKKVQEHMAPQHEAHPYYADQESMQMASSYGYGGGTSKYYSGPHAPAHGMPVEHQGYSNAAYSQPGSSYPSYTGSAMSHTGGSQPGYSHGTAQQGYSHGMSQQGYSHGTSQQGYSHGTSGMSPQASNVFMAGSTPTATASTFDVGTWRTMVTQQRTMAAPDDRDKLERALDNFAQTQTPFLGRFAMLSAAHRRAGGQGVVQFARNVRDGEEYAIKFFTQRSAFDREFELYSNPVLRGMMPAITHIEPNTNGEARSMTGWPMPPCIVIERGESLDNWALRIKPDFTTILQVLTHVATRLEQLHESGLVHRDLKPGNVLWRPQHLAWTLIDFGCAAHTDQEAPLSFSLKYAAPEIVAAYESKQRTIVASPAMDMWALGLMAYELLTDTSAFPAGTAAKTVCDQISGREPLPWEDPVEGDARLAKLRMLRRTLTSCLSRDPAERPTSSGLLASWNRLFDSVMGDKTYAPA
eukprot:jgi/Ulvmu1/5254/UM022_0047.1